MIQLDLLPTALAAAGVEAQTDWKLDGKNLLPYVTGEKKDAAHEALYWRFGEQGAIRKGDWKLVKIGSELSLFNLADDIGEKKDLAKERPVTVKELQTAWKQWESELMPPRWRRAKN